MIPNNISLDQLNEFCRETAVSNLDIEFTAVGSDFIEAKMPVSAKTIQPFGLLHGGASVLLAETLGSIAAGLIVGPGKVPVGLEINANHIKSAKKGFVVGRATPIHIGRSTHLWEIRIHDEEHNLVTISKLTMAILDEK
ncbi:MAG: hotdog fold thioesterase [Cyclobacteriaceae bacterium]